MHFPGNFLCNFTRRNLEGLKFQKVFYVSSGFDHLGVIILKMKDLCQEKERRDVYCLMWCSDYTSNLVMICTSWQISILWQHTCTDGGKANVVCMQFSGLWYCVLGTARRGVCQYCLLAVWPPATEHWQCTKLATCQTNRQWCGVSLVS